MANLVNFAVLLLKAKVGFPSISSVQIDRQRSRLARLVMTDKNAHEHSSPFPVIDVEVVLNDPALRELEVPSVRDLVADRGHDARRLARLEDDHHSVRLGAFEIRIDEFITTAFRRLYDRDVALCSSLLRPALKLVGDVAQGIPRHRV